MASRERRRREALRLKVLRAIQRTPHRYGVLRALGMAASLGCLALVPLSGLARIDLWGGAHRRCSARCRCASAWPQ